MAIKYTEEQLNTVDNEKISAVHDIFCQQHGRCNSIYVQSCSDLSFSCSHCKHMALCPIVYIVLFQSPCRSDYM